MVAKTVYPEEYKFGVFGDAQVGKSAICLRLTRNAFVDEPQYLEDAYRRYLSVDDRPCILELIDMPDLEYEYQVMTNCYIRSCCGFLLVFSVVDRASFDRIHLYREAILRQKDPMNDSDIPMVLVGHKSDLAMDERVVQAREAKEYAFEIGVPYVECSSKQSTGVDECFATLVQETRQRTNVSTTAVVDKSCRLM